ncbi:staygreen family protein [Bacillus massilioanorexius]|nr:staygreen family protein [Bacillus massilioanorexius]
MTRIRNNQLSTTILPPATEFAPVEGRKYTVTHDDVSGHIFVSIGYSYDESNLTDMRDEVIATWVPHLGQYALIGKVYVTGGEFDENTSQIRYMIFKMEMEKALRAIIAGDNAFYHHLPWFLDFPIFIHFDSIIAKYNQVIYFGTPRNYLKNNGLDVTDTMNSLSNHRINCVG